MKWFLGLYYFLVFSRTFSVILLQKETCLVTKPCSHPLLQASTFSLIIQKFYKTSFYWISYTDVSRGKKYYLHGSVLYNYKHELIWLALHGQFFKFLLCLICHLYLFTLQCVLPLIRAWITERVLENVKGENEWQGGIQCSA